MRPAVAPKWSPLGVEREFETNRLALDHQARGYEEVLPSGGRFLRKAAHDPVEMDVDAVLVSEKGIAA
jgi:hypothetical protein